MSGERPVDPAAVGYIKANRGKYSDEAIRKSLLGAGHSAAAVDAAFASLREKSPRPAEPKKAGAPSYLGLFFLAVMVFLGAHAVFKLFSGRRSFVASWAGELAAYAPARYASLARLEALLPVERIDGDAAEEYAAVARDWFEASREAGVAPPPDLDLIARAAVKRECRILGARWTPEHWATLIVMQGLASQLERAVGEFQARAEAKAAAWDGAGAEADFRLAAAVSAHMLGSWSPAMRYAGASGIVSTGLKMVRAFGWSVSSPERRVLGFLFKDVRAHLPEAETLDAIAAAAKEPSEMKNIGAYLKEEADRAVYLVWALDSAALSLSDGEFSRRALAPERRAFLESWARHPDRRTAALALGYLKVAGSIESEMRGKRPSLDRRAGDFARMSGRLHAGVDRFKAKF